MREEELVEHREWEWRGVDNCVSAAIRENMTSPPHSTAMNRRTVFLSSRPRSQLPDGREISDALARLRINVETPKERERLIRILLRHAQSEVCRFEISQSQSF